jgi:O-antigen/teichoic acid export membrane protein
VGKLGVTTLRIMALFSLPAAFGLAALCDPSMRLVYGAKYLPAIPVLLVTALFSVGRALQMPAQRVLVTTEKQGFLVTWGLTLAVVNVGTSLLFIPSMGAMGAAYSKGIVQTIAMIGLWVYARRRTNTIVPLAQMIGLLAVSGAMFGLVRFLSVALPGSVLDLVIGIPVGIIVTIVGLRLIRFLDPDDRRRLGPLERLMPGFAKAWFGRLVRFLAPEPRRDPTGLVGGVE